MIRKFHITTFGCQMNEHDSETIAGLLHKEGFEHVQERKAADIVIINTCSVRENADKRFFGTLGQLKKRKETDDNFVVCVCGCMMQQEHIVNAIKSKYPWVDIVFGTHNIANFPNLLRETIEDRRKLIEVLPDLDRIQEGLPVSRLYKHKALVNIMYGCNNFCTYCIVPYTRGREKSRDQEDIVNEVKSLVSDGVLEIMLLGQNVNSYRGTKGADFADLIYMLNDIEGLKRIRFMTSHPKDISDKLIEAFSRCDKLCNNIHLPVQSGSNSVLKKMNRKYTVEHYMDRIAKLKKAVPGITISTDIIVGFPGETEEDFEETIKLVDKVQYDSAFTFLYSPRKGTPAEKYEEQIDEETKHRRFDRLVETLNVISKEKNKAYEGKVEKVLVESVSKNNKHYLTGRTEGFKLVNFKGDESLIGSFADVKIISGKTFSLDGIIVEKDTCV